MDSGEAGIDSTTAPAAVELHETTGDADLTADEVLTAADNAAPQDGGDGLVWL